MSNAARPPEGGAPSGGDDLAQRQEGTSACGWLQSDVAFITGGAAGIGLAVTRRYLQEGAAGVVVLDLDERQLSATQDEFPGRIAFIRGDVREYASHELAVATALERFGRLDVTVANAGVFDFRRPLHGYTPALLAQTMDELFAINLRGYLYAALASREALQASGGTVIVTASVASFHAGGGGILYTMGKHALVGLVRQLALEWAPHIRVNGVGPGGTLTALGGTQALGHEERSIDAKGDLGERIAAHVPLRFAQLPDDHAGLYVLLASRRNARAVTGQIFMSDGGVGIRAV